MLFLKHRKKEKPGIFNILCVFPSNTFNMDKNFSTKLKKEKKRLGFMLGNQTNIVNSDTS